MRERKLYPERRFDRVLLWTGEMGLILFCATMFGARQMWLWPLWKAGIMLLAMVGALVGMWAYIYLVQTIPRHEVEDYTAIIANIDDIGKKLSDLNVFLRRERDRVEESEATLAKLRNEQTELEPVVTAHKETVEAILTAHAKATASRVWKERILAFMIGILASFLAALLFEFLKPK